MDPTELPPLATYGEIVITFDEDGSITMWEDGRQPLILEGHAKRVHCVVFSPDGKTVASAGTDNMVKLWDTVSGQVRVTHNEGAICLAYSPNGRTLAACTTVFDSEGYVGGPTSNTPCQVKLWDAGSLRERVTPMKVAGPMLSIAFSPDGKTLATCGIDGSVTLWDPIFGQQRASLKGSSMQLVFAPHSRVLATFGMGGVKLWEAEGWQGSANEQVSGAPSLGARP